MDHRLKALIEVRDLLKSEGWAPTEPDLGGSTASLVRSPHSSRQRFMTFLCATSIMVNIALIGSGVYLKAELKQNHASILITSIEFSKAMRIPLESQPGNQLSLTANGTRIWVGPPFSSGPLISSGANPTVTFDSQCILQLWIRKEGLDGLIGLAIVKPETLKSTPFNIDLQLDGYTNAQLTARMSLENSHPAELGLARLNSQ